MTEGTGRYAREGGTWQLKLNIDDKRQRITVEALHTLEPSLK
jgi:hypothetical protein